MTSADVKQYLEKLYDVKVIDVRIEIEKGKYMTHPAMPGRLSPPSDDLKFAYVQIKDTFEWPKIFEKKLTDTIKEETKQISNMHNKIKNKNLDRLDIGGWFA